MLNPPTRLETISFDGKIFLIDSPSQMEEFYKNEYPLLLNAPVLGFDTETKPSFQKGEHHKVALLQLATQDKAFLFRLNHIGLPQVLGDLFENQSIVKVGLAIRDDLKGLNHWLPFTPQSFVELQDLAEKAQLKSRGLQGLTEEVLEKKLSKKAKLTNWENKNLSPDQLKYAATDAWIGLLLYNNLMRH